MLFSMPKKYTLTMGGGLAELERMVLGRMMARRARKAGLLKTPAQQAARRLNMERARLFLAMRRARINECTSACAKPPDPPVSP